MNERPTPRTDKLEWVTEYCEKVVCSDVARTLERELAELREVYDLDTQTLRAERDEARDALRVRIGERVVCDECEYCIDTHLGSHAETCRHYQTEREVMQ